MEFIILPGDKKGLVCETLAQSLDFIDRLQIDNKKLQDRYNRLCEHTEKIESELNEKELDISWFNNPNMHLAAPTIRKIIAEEIEEFAEMITDRASAVQVGNVSWVWQISQDDIDELVKAKVGEKR